MKGRIPLCFVKILRRRRRKQSKLWTTNTTFHRIRRQTNNLLLTVRKRIKKNQESNRPFLPWFSRKKPLTKPTRKRCVTKDTWDHFASRPCGPLPERKSNANRSTNPFRGILRNSTVLSRGKLKKFGGLKPNYYFALISAINRAVSSTSCGQYSRSSYRNDLFW